MSFSTRDERRVSLRKGHAVRKDKVTVEQYMAEWLPMHSQTKPLSPNTVYGYGRHICIYIVPFIGRMKMQDVTTMTISRLYADLLIRQSARTVEYTGTILRMAWFRPKKGYPVPFAWRESTEILTCDMGRKNAKIHNGVVRRFLILLDTIHEPRSVTRDSRDRRRPHLAAGRKPARMLQDPRLAAHQERPHPDSRHFRYRQSADDDTNPPR